MIYVVLFILVAFVAIVGGAGLYMIGPELMDDMIDAYEEWRRVLSRIHEGRDNHD